MVYIPLINDLDGRIVLKFTVIQGAETPLPHVMTSLYTVVDYNPVPHLKVEYYYIPSTYPMNQWSLSRDFM